MIYQLARKAFIILLWILSLLNISTEVVAKPFETGSLAAKPLALNKHHSGVTSQENTNKKAIDAFHLAMTDAQNRLDYFRQNNLAVSLIQTSEDLNGQVFQQQFIPRGYKKNTLMGDWKTLQADDDFNETLTVDNNMFFEGERLNQSSAKLVSETEFTWTFQLDNMVNIATDDESESSQEASKAFDEKIKDNLSTELTIDKKSAQIKQIKIYAKSELKPNWMVTIDKFELRLNYKEAWPNGPIIRQSMTRHVKGQYGLLVSLDELVTTELSQISKVQLTDKPL